MKTKMKYEKLTESEELVMKAAWDLPGDVCLPDVVDLVNERYKKDWKPQTVSTFLARLVRKNYLKLFRTGRYFHYDILISELQYKSQLIRHHVQFWNAGDLTAFACDLCDKETLSGEDVKRLRSKLNELD